jgi:4-diphosphocytidyl-2-C-methyl-D-erythritol kinase
VSPVVLTAPAKVTLALRVVGVRADGYHLIEADMVTVDLHDLVVLDPLLAGDAGADVIEVVDETMGSGGNVAVVPAGDDNLVRAALVLSGRWARVRLHKRIPAGAGLGGGSADAAAVLRWAGVTDPLQAVAIGADVPFCVAGGRARVAGVGEMVDPAPHEPLVLTLATPPFGCSTPAVYAVWDDMGGPTAEGPNDLEPAALVVEPRLAAWRDALGSSTGQVPVLAGSGSTWFVRGAHPGPGRVVVEAVPSGWVAPGADA